MIIRQIRIHAVVLSCLAAFVGCNRSNDVEIAKAEAEVATTKAEGEAAPVAQTQPKAVDVDRRAAEWVLRTGGSLTATVDGAVLVVNPGETLPDKSLHLVSVNFDRKGQVLDEGLEYLQDLPGLETVNLTAQPKVTSVAHFKGSPRLRELFLRHTGVTDAGLESIKSLPQLEQLAIGDTQVTDAGLEHLKGLNKLKVLDLAACKNVTEGGLAHLTGLPGLETLILTGLPVTDKGLEHLKDIKSLKTVEANGTKVTDEGVKSLQAALPNCQVSK